MAEPGATENAGRVSATPAPSDSKGPTHQRRFASEFSINALFVITLLVVVVNVVWFLLVPTGIGELWHRDWLGRHQPWGPSTTERLANVIVGSPILGTCVAVAYACCWPFMNRTTTLRTVLIWAMALTFAICGWPVACGCIMVEGFARYGPAR